MAAKNIKIFLWLIGVCLLSSCFTRPALMTRESFDNIQIGSSYANIAASVGEPYNVNSIGEDTKEYEYIEKMELGSEVTVENHYFLIVTNGQVVGKRATQERSPAFNLIYQEDPNHDNYNYP